MSRDARRILWFGLAGFAIAVVFGFLGDVIEPTPDTKLSLIIGLVELVLCPGTLTFVLAIDIEPGSSGYLLMWLTIAAINFALYTALGVAYVGLFKRHRTEMRE